MNLQISTNLLLCRRIFHGPAIRRRLQSRKSNEQSANYYEGMITRRREEAQRSIIVRSGRVDVGRRNELYKMITHCTANTKPKLVRGFQNDSFLVELESVSVVKAFLRDHARHFDQAVVPSTSRQLFFVYNSRKNGFEANTRNNERMKQLFRLNDKMQRVNSVSKQMEVLHDTLSLTDTGVRLRFFLASLIEEAFSGIFPRMFARPFGSSVNGVGTDASDLDLNISFDYSHMDNSSQTALSNFLYCSKVGLRDDRNLVRNTLKTIIRVLETFFPGVESVVPILHCRVPIVRFNHSITGIQCDISFSNNGGANEMSRILFTLGRIDPRLRPLVFTIRKWAADVELTCTNTGKTMSYNLTNFHLLALAIFFLQSCQPRILPTFSELKEEIGDSSGSPGTRSDFSQFVRTYSSQNSATLEDLLGEFFEFYAKFDFDKWAISLEHGTMYDKPDQMPIFMDNPLEANHNMTKVVSSEHLNRFVTLCRGTLCLLSENRTRKVGEEWGLRSIFNLGNYTAEARSNLCGGKTGISLDSLFDSEEGGLEESGEGPEGMGENQSERKVPNTSVLQN